MAKKEKAKKRVPKPKKYPFYKMAYLVLGELKNKQVFERYEHAEYFAGNLSSQRMQAYEFYINRKKMFIDDEEFNFFNNKNNTIMIYIALMIPADEEYKSMTGLDEKECILYCTDELELERFQAEAIKIEKQVWKVANLKYPGYDKFSYVKK